MGHHDQQHPSDHAEGLPALLSVFNPVLKGHLQGIAEDLGGLLEAQPMLALVGQVLGLVPLEPN